jgi:hypothetical protein
MLVFLRQCAKRNFFLLFLFKYVIQHCCICRPTDSTVSEDAGIEPRTVATLALTARRLITWLDLIQQELYPNVTRRFS